MQVRTENIRIFLDGNAILKGIDFNADEKSFVGIIGPNGSGKSTLLKCIYRTLKPDDGAVFLEGTSLMELTLRESAKKLAVVAQHNYYNFEFAVSEVVMMGRAPYKRMLDKNTAADQEIAAAALKKVDMYSFFNRSFSSLSGGEQQRVLLARALAQQTPCLILDEPTNHLDIKYQLQLMDIVKDLEINVIAAIHDLNIAALYCDYIYVLQEGTIVADGTPREVITADMIKRVYEVDARVLEAEERLHVLYQPRAGKC